MVYLKLNPSQLDDILYVRYPVNGNILNHDGIGLGPILLGCFHCHITVYIIHTLEGLISRGLNFMGINFHELPSFAKISSREMRKNSET